MVAASHVNVQSSTALVKRAPAEDCVMQMAARQGSREIVALWRLIYVMPWEDETRSLLENAEPLQYFWVRVHWQGPARTQTSGTASDDSPRLWTTNTKELFLSATT